MGIFDIFKSQKREAAEMKQMLSGVTESFAGIAALAAGLRLIGYPTPDHWRWGDEVTGKGAAALTRYFATETKTDLGDMKTAMGSALFALIAANHFSYITRSNFEDTGLHAMLDVIEDPEMIKEIIPEVLEIYNDWSADAGNYGKLISRTGQSIAGWAASPTPQNLHTMGAHYLFLARRGAG